MHPDSAAAPSNATPSEHDLRQSSDRLRALVQASPLAIVGLDANGLVDIWSSAAERILGWTEHEVLGHSDPSVPDDRRGDLDHEISLAREGRSLTEIETERCTKAGKRVAVNLSTAPLSGLGGEYCGLVSLRYRTEDLTLAERLASIASLAIENARLYRESQQATKIRDHVLSVVAHDLRNPLSTVAMTIGLLLESNATDERVSKQLRMSQRALGRANVLIRDLLDVARMQGGRLSVDTKPESVIGLLRETCEMQSQLARAKAISLTCQVPDDLPDVQLDPNRVRPVLGNLLDNATKFTPSDGRIHLRGESRDGDVVISVSDTGPGIPADEIPKLFEAFCGNRKHILL